MHNIQLRKNERQYEEGDSRDMIGDCAEPMATSRSTIHESKRARPVTLLNIANAVVKRNDIAI